MQLLSLSASKCKNIQNIPCPTFADIASAIRALTSLNLADNALGSEGAKHVAEAIKVHVSAQRLDSYHFELDLTSGSTAVVYGYCYYNTTKGALTSLNLASNSLQAEGAKHVAAALPECK